MYYYRYFMVPQADPTLKNHIIRPHTRTTFCGWQEDVEDDRRRLANNMRKDCGICNRCLTGLRASLDTRGTEAVALHVYKELVDYLIRAG